MAKAEQQKQSPCERKTMVEKQRRGEQFYAGLELCKEPPIIGQWSFCSQLAFAEKWEVPLLLLTEELVGALDAQDNGMFFTGGHSVAKLRFRKSVLMFLLTMNWIAPKLFL